MIQDLAQPFSCHPDDCCCHDCDDAREAASLAADLGRTSLLMLAGVLIGLLIAGGVLV